MSKPGAVEARNIERNEFSWLAIAKRLWRMKKADLFASRAEDRINVEEMIAPGKVSILDLSDMDAPYIRNIVIAQILRRLQSWQDTLQGARSGRRQDQAARPDEHLHRGGARIPFRPAHQADA